jgi:dimethylglycine dehydrogenase
MVHFGAYAMNVMRLEKGYKAWGGELTTEITPVEARLDRFIDLDSGRDFVGRDAVLARQATAGDDGSGLSMVLVYAEVNATDSDVRGNEPCFPPGSPDGTPSMGVTTGGCWSHTTGRSICFAYVAPEHAAPGATFEIRLFNQRHTATVLAEPVHDPANDRLRA